MRNTKTIKMKIHTSRLTSLSYFGRKGCACRMNSVGEYTYVEIDIPITDSVLETVILE
jgi:hypothetical protein